MQCSLHRKWHFNLILKRSLVLLFYIAKLRLEQNGELFINFATTICKYHALKTFFLKLFLKLWEMVNHIAHNSVSISIVLELKYLIKFIWIMWTKTSKKFDPWMDIISQVGLVNFLGILICLDAKHKLYKLSGISLERLCWWSWEMLS